MNTATSETLQFDKFGPRMRKSSETKYTTDYSMFKFMGGNRNIDERHVKHIMSLICEFGYVQEDIIVNEFMEICEGQHRFEALKRLGLPIPYKIVPGLRREHVILLNTSSKNWRTVDYIDSYASDNNPSYQRLKQLLHDLSKDGVKLECVISFIHPGYKYMKPSMMKRIKEGDFVFTKERYEFIRERLNKIVALSVIEYQKCNKIPMEGFYAALGYAFDHPDVDAVPLIRRILKVYDLPHFRSAHEMLRVFDGINNKGKPMANRVFMEADFKKGLYFPKASIDDLLK